MIYTIVYERIKDKSLQEGYYLSHIPSLDLTNGAGIAEGVTFQH